MEGSKDTRRAYLTNLMKLLVFGYKHHKLAAMRISSDLSDKYEVRAHQHYEALRNLKEALICGKTLLENDMPEVKPE